MFSGWKHKNHIKCDYQRICAMSEEERMKDWMRTAREGWDQCWEIITNRAGWHHESGKSVLGGGIVYSKHYIEVGKIFKLEGVVEAPPEMVFNVLVHGDNDSPAWNPTVTECRTIVKLNENTDIAYNIAAEGAGGLVSSRDFVNLRHWKTRDNISLSLGHVVSHPDYPPSKKHVRGENRPSCWAFQKYENDPNRCLFTLVLHIDLKGWLPAYLVEQTISHVMINYLVYLRKRCGHLLSLAPDHPDRVAHMAAPSGYDSDSDTEFSTPSAEVDKKTSKIARSCGSECKKDSCLCSAMEDMSIQCLG